MKRQNTIVLALKSQEIDLEYCQFEIETGKTYEDDGTTIFDVYIADGLKNGSFRKVARRADTILVHHPDA